MKFLVSLKNPPLTYLVDSFEDKLLKELPNVKFSQGGAALIIPILVTSNIASIKEITDEEAVAWRESAREANLKATGRITKPQFQMPGKRINQ